MRHSPQVDMYRIMLLQIKRSTVRGGIIINAKPVFLITLINMIEEGKVKNNEFYFDEILKTKYEETHKELIPDAKITPCYRPFYHLVQDGFWTVNWKNGIPDPHGLTDRKVRENVEYAKMDNVLWDVLQDKEVRKYYRDAIKDYFLTQ